MMPVFMPIGIIDESTQDGGIFSLTRPDDHKTLQAGDPVTVWNMHQQFETMARLKGEITEVSRTTASYIITERQVDPSWPDYVDPFGAGNPIYLAVRDSFNPDPFRKPSSPDEYQMLKEFAKQHQEATGIETRGAAFAFAPVRNVDYDDR